MDKMNTAQPLFPHLPKRLEGLKELVENMFHPYMQQKKGHLLEPVSRDHKGWYAERKKVIRRILILTDNIFLGTIIKNRKGGDYVDCFGFYFDLKGLIGSIKEVEVNVVNRGEQFKSISPMRLSFSINSIA